MAHMPFNLYLPALSKVQKILDTEITKVMIFGIPGKYDIPFQDLRLGILWE
jgi:hypothetical protein